MNIIHTLGLYYQLMAKIVAKPEKPSVYLKLIVDDLEKIGINSAGIVAIISVFMGAVITLQTAININSPLIPRYLIGFAARESILLEFSSTMVSLILAGKVGSNIASEIGTMRVTEQIDALEIMGVNSAGYLILPKIIAFVIFIPVLVILSITIGVFGGWLAGLFTGVISTGDYLLGVQFDFHAYKLVYTLIKAEVFAFVIASVSGFHGYYAKGGALDVGRASTKAVVYSMVLILMFNLLLSYFLLL
ncbi:MAG: hypothetical protein RIS47_841 [Bacteroidota bacterium]|jgi:phospholipid/cholesterol/gamma-HCH transport system permease protein